MNFKLKPIPGTRQGLCSFPIHVCVSGYFLNQTTISVVQYFCCKDLHCTYIHCVVRTQ